MADNQSSPTKSSSVGDSNSQKQEAFTHLAQGKRHLLVKDYIEAVSSLEKACKLLDEQYGECANECGDAYFNYGKALLELARSESGVLGDAIEGEHDGSNEDDDDDDEAGDADEEDGDETKEGKSEDEDKKEETEDNKEEGTENKENSPKEDGETSDTEDESTLKLAWEILELAKLVFQRQAEGNEKVSLILAEVHLKLGEVSLEDENYARAIEDIESCLRIQKEYLPEDDRFIAETYYQLGIAYSLNTDFDQAIENFKNAIDVISKRIKNLEAKKESGIKSAEENKSDPFYSIEGEIKELKELLPEMDDKVSDMEDFKKETLKAVFGNMNGQASAGSNGGAGGSSSTNDVQPGPAVVEAKPVSNISHLVRKKRKPDEAGEDTKGTEPNVPAKQSKTE